MNAWENKVRIFTASVDDVADVNIARSFDIGVTAPAVRMNRRFQFKSALEEIGEIHLRAVGDDGKPNAAELGAVPFHGTSDDCLTSGAAPAPTIFRASDPRQSSCARTEAQAPLATCACSNVSLAFHIFGTPGQGNAKTNSKTMIALQR